MGSAPSEQHHVDEAIRESEKLVRESNHALEELRKERKRSEEVIETTRRSTSPSPRDGKSNGR